MVPSGIAQARLESFMVVNWQCKITVKFSEIYCQESSLFLPTHNLRTIGPLIISLVPGDSPNIPMKDHDYSVSLWSEASQKRTKVVSIVKTQLLYVDDLYHNE